jgi:hypothetical protein
MDVTVIIEGLEEAEALCNRNKALINPVTLDVLRKEVLTIVKVAQANAPVGKTGALQASLDILSERITSNSIEIDAGSTISGYPFWQEYGWTSRSGKSIPGKYYFTQAVEMGRVLLPENVLIGVAMGLPGVE